MNIDEKLNQIKEKLNNIKPEFEEYIKDTSISLQERWSSWILAPSEFKNHSNYIIHFNNLPEDFIMYDGGYHADKYETVKMVDVVEHIEDALTSEWTTSEELSELLSINMVAFKEEILSLNLESFEYDW